MAYERLPYKRIKLGVNQLCLSSLDRNIIRCIKNYVQPRGKVEQISFINREVWEQIKPSITTYHIWKCLLIMALSKDISLKNWKNNKKETKWRVEVRWID